ncbi:MAG: cyclic nucleotide-binding protein, partial [Desulfobacteraceae bacterium 4572_35.1]
MPNIMHLRDSEPFTQLPQEVFDAILAASSIKKFPAHYHIFNQNEPFLGNLFVIKNGLVEITLLTPSGEEIVVDYRDEGRIFGCTPLFTNEPYTGGARTVQQTECYIIPQQILIETADAIPVFKKFFDHMILKRVRDMYSNIVAEHSKKALTQVESYPFKKRLSEIMSTPVAHCQ